MLTDELDHYITAEKLVELLQKLPPGCVVAVNHIGNLSVGRTATGPNGFEFHYIGYIDTGSETVEL